VRDGRLHLALPVDSEAPTAPPPPTVHLSVPRPAEPIPFAKPLPATVRCSEACDVRVFVPDRRGFPRALATTSLRRAGSRRLLVAPQFAKHVVPRGARHIRVTAHACAPSGRSYSSDSDSLRLARPKLAPLPRPLGLEAHRHNHKVVVTWRTRRPVHHVEFDVEGLDRDGEEVAGSSVPGFGRTTFSDRLDPFKRGRIVRVRFTVRETTEPHRERTRTIRVR
jgi:hypothetical protein